MAEHLTAQHSAIKMLHSRVKLVLEYVKAVQGGKLRVNHEILREAYSLGHRLPVLQSDRFTTDFYNVGSAPWSQTLNQPTLTLSLYTGS